MSLIMANGSIGMSGRSYDAFVSSQRTFNDTDWAAKIQEKYWRARQKFLSKVEKKEDACVVLSDTKLDAKLQIYKSIDRSCARLTNILENYQNCLFVFANEENALGILLKECGKYDKTKAGKIMSITGKSLTQSSHQRIRLYMPLLRLYQEMETFHSRAVADTAETVNKLEDKRSQYRASLLWMKNISEKLDPDIYRQLDKFRRVQNQVRTDKKAFDSLQMDVVQKIDLLMASRCNLMNQILAPYQAILLETFDKCCNNFRSVEEMIKREDIYEYEFKALKQLNPLQISDSPTHHPVQEQEPPDLLGDSQTKEAADQNNNNNERNLLSNDGDAPDALIDVSLDGDGSKLERPNLAEPRNAMDTLETLFGSSPSEAGQNDIINTVSGDRATKQESKQSMDDIKLLRSNLNANLLDVEDNERQVEQLLGPSEANKYNDMFAEWSDILNKANAEPKSSNDLNPKQIPSSSSSKDTKQKKGNAEGKDVRSSSDIDLMGESSSVGPRGASDSDNIMDLLTNELDDIDNSSYFKSLKNLQI